MSSKDKLYELVGLGCIALGSLLNFHSYYTRNIDCFETKLLKGTSEYLQELKDFEKNDYNKAIDYTLNTIDIARNFNPEKINELEKVVLDYKETFRSDSKINEPLLIHISQKLNDASDVKAKRKRDLGSGILFGISALIYGYFSFKKKE